MTLYELEKTLDFINNYGFSIKDVDYLKENALCKTASSGASYTSCENILIGRFVCQERLTE